MSVMPMKLPRHLIIAAMVTALIPAISAVADQESDEKATATQERVREPFSWSNPPSAEQSHPRMTHGTFTSPSMGIPVGYNIYLPQDYGEDENRNVRYPVIYYLHGGRPGNESKDISLVGNVHAAIESRQVRPIIFVWVNGGEVSHYNFGDSRGEDVFVGELIPYIDRTYRTIDHRGGRALQGFSQGGRGTTRIMFKHPELFISAAPGGPGYGMERQIFENGGVEHDNRWGRTGAALDFGEGNDAFSLARGYARQPTQPPLKILIWVGTNGFNYEATLDYLDFLSGLEISAERLVVPDVDHNLIELYEKRGIDLLGFHDEHWSGFE